MPSAYLLAKDHIEQARAMLANEVWFDPEMDHLFDVALARLNALDAKIYDDNVTPLPRRPGPRRRARMMPWLDP
ncbi:hypothetical protein [Pelagibacterium sp. H642]|uniref:hypothetical protein n=1 Tax=Pelagibacterium sp. H642 TaxID=1881069 RepID=UPI00281542FC|nr:hypothetical protein [Pelagibacterium sp. H642]WMT91466.1 hypothetical protein NO934_04165 [Pelagibacterium sp. H642]